MNASVTKIASSLASSAVNASLKTATFARRIDSLFAQLQEDVYTRIDRLFAILLLIEWLVGILTAFVISPKTWIGTNSTIHIHVYMAIFLGAAIISLPIILALTQPGKTVTRHVIAIGQMLMSALLIDLTGGRIETHFHIFGSLAFLAFYYDWKVLITASVVVVIDHVLLGLYFPQSIYGSQTVQPWRWVEHAGWVVFQDIFLIYACHFTTKEMHMRAQRIVEIESSRERVELQVSERTRELKASEQRVSAQYAISSCLHNSAAIEDAGPQILSAIGNGLIEDIVSSSLWTFDKASEDIVCIASSSKQEFTSACSANLARLIWTKREAQTLAGNEIDDICPDFVRSVEERPIAAYAFPIIAENVVLGVVQFFFYATSSVNEETATTLHSTGQQIAQFIVHKQAEFENQRLASIVRSTIDSIIGLDEHGYITNWNSGAERLYGWQAEAVIGQPYSILLLPENIDETNALIDSIRSKGQLENYETEHKRRDGTVVNVSQSWTVINEGSERLGKLSIIERDISEKKDAERRVSEFYSTVSHELRTPLTSICASLGLLEGGKGGELSPKAKNLVKIGRDEANRLVRLINDILDIKKIEAGKLELKLESLPVPDLIRTCLEGLKGFADAHHVQLLCGADCSENILGDRDRVMQVLINLASNAMKFSPSESTVEISAINNGLGKVRFSVKDSGPGIAPEQMSKLFRKFQQIDSSDKRAKGGTGLGLAISKNIVEEHGGTIGLDSKLGEGSTFWFEIPIAPVALKSDKAVIDHSQDGKPTHLHKLLLIEDDHALAEVIALSLQSEPFTIEHAATIAEAEKLLTKFTPDVIIMDVNLPDGSGLDFTAKLQQQAQTADIPVVVLTGNQCDQNAFTKLMIVDWIRKPCDETRLRQALTFALQRKHLSSGTVLVVEDDAVTREFIVDSLTSLGLTALEALDGADAIHYIRKSHPDLIVLDLDIPAPDGFDVIQILRNEETRTTPLIVYSNHDLTAQDKKSLTLGLTKHLSKTKTSQNEFLLAVRELMIGLVKEDQ
jgi:PAS domain S-box-containing protein